MLSKAAELIVDSVRSREPSPYGIAAAIPFLPVPNGQDSTSLRMTDWERGLSMVDIRPRQDRQRMGKERGPPARKRKGLNANFNYCKLNLGLEGGAAADREDHDERTDTEQRIG